MPPSTTTHLISYKRTHDTLLVIWVRGGALQDVIQPSPKLPSVFDARRRASASRVLAPLDLLANTQSPTSDLLFSCLAWLTFPIPSTVLSHYCSIHSQLAAWQANNKRSSPFFETSKHPANLKHQPGLLAYPGAHDAVRPPNQPTLLAPHTSMFR